MTMSPLLMMLAGVVFGLGLAARWMRSKWPWWGGILMVVWPGVAMNVIAWFAFWFHDWPR